MPLFKSSAERQLEKFEKIYWNELRSLILMWQSQDQDGIINNREDYVPLQKMSEEQLARIHRGAFAKARYEVLGIQRHERTPDLDPLMDNLWSRAKRDFLHGQQR